MDFERAGVELLRDHVKEIVNKVTEDGNAVVLTRYGKDIAALVPLEFLLLCEEADLLNEASVVARPHFLGAGRCVKCGKKANDLSTPLFGPWHFPTCSRYRAPKGILD